MATPEHDEKPASPPLEAERERLRKAGYTDTEISQILVARALGSSGHSADAPTSQGVLSGTLSSVMAIGSYARGTVFTIRHDLATIFDATALASARVGAAAMLVFKVAVIAVLAYAGWQEWHQHIISATEIADSQARKIRAEECSARIKAIIDSVPINKLGEATEIVQRDCDPTYAARAKTCDDRFQVILNDIDHMDGNDPAALNAMTEKIKEHKSECVITDAQSQAAAEKAAKFRTESDKAKKASALITRLREIVQIEEAHKAGNYAEALKLSEAHVAATEAEEIKKDGKAGKDTGSALANLSWEALFARDFNKAYDAATRSIKLIPSDSVPITNQAHALMLLGRTEEAKAIYLTHKGESLQGKTWEKVISEDFAKLREAGITHPMMAEIERALSGQPAPTEPLSGPLAAASPVPDPDVEAVRQYKLAADRGDAEAQLNLGRMYGTGRGGLAPDLREAARLYKLSADQGNAVAQLQLAYMYENGDVLPKDWPEAARLYRLAADQGNPEAQANLADFYERGDAGLRRNACEAMRLRKLAAAQGNAYAERSLKEANATRCKP
jgi:TPR repeat protein